MGDTFKWNAVGFGTYDNPSNWTDTSTSPTSTTGFPGSLDTAMTDGPISGTPQTLVGPGNAATLDVSGMNELIGTFATGLTNINSATGTTYLDLQGALSATLGLRVGNSGTGYLQIMSGSTVTAASSSGTNEVAVGNSAGSSGTITVASGATLLLNGTAEINNYSLNIGNSGTGLVVVTGTGATVNTVDDGTAIGDLAGSSGTLVVSQGGTFDTFSANSATLSALAIGRAGSGTLIVTDPGSTLYADGSMYIGRADTGVAAIQNYGVITAGATSSVSIGDGNGTASTLSGSTGFLELTTHGTLNDLGSLVVGGNGDSGLVTIDNSVLDASIQVKIGVGTTIGTQYLTGTGTVQISDSGTLALLTPAETFTGIGVGFASASEGVIDVTGTGALLDVANNLLSIGAAGTGTVVVSQGGSVFAASPGVGFGAVVLGNNVGAVGTLDVDGASSSVTAQGALTDGFSGSGLVSITNGATVSAVTGFISYNTGSTGTLSVSGSNSALDVGGSLSIGATTTGGTGNGLLEIGSGGVVNAGTATVGPLGIAELSGATLSTSSGLTIAPGGTLAGFGVIGGAVNEGGSLIATGGLDLLGAVSGSGGNAYVGAGADLIYANSVAVLETDFTSTGRIDLLAPGAFTGVIGGITTGDTIFAAGAASIAFGGGSVISLLGTGGSQIGTIALDGSYAATTFIDNGDTITEAPCFLAGTRIDTPEGPIAVEALRPGMMVTTWRKGAPVPAPVRWTGRRRVDVRRHPDPDLVRPVRVARDAFGPGQPARALFLSPDHAVFEDGVLIPVKHLINGHSIAAVPARTVEYWHVELDRHDILRAEGLRVESYLDTGNRAAFENGRTIQLHPDFSPRGWGDACAELIQEGERLRAIKQRLFERVRPSFAASVTTLRVCAGRAVLTPVAAANGTWHYRLPAGAEVLTLRSPAWIPASREAGSLDRRRLGVRLFGIALDGRPLTLTDRALQAGFHPLEQTAEGVCRWTDGRARLVLPLGGRELVLRLRGSEAVAA